MYSKKKNFCFKIYIYYFFLVSFLTYFSTSNLKAKIYKVNNIQINEPYKLNFEKNKVITKAFLDAFNQLMSKITLSKDRQLLDDISLPEIQKLINSFVILNENFIENKYSATLEVDFDKQKILNFLESKKVFSAVPIRKKILIIPIMINENKNQVYMFSENTLYNNWNRNHKSSYLINYILPNEDLEDINILKKKINNVENENFNEIISKYDIADYIVLIKYLNNNNLKILSKINFNENQKIINKSYQNIDLNNKYEIENLIEDLKNVFEDSWKEENLINTSLKLLITLSVDSNDFKLINKLERKLKVSDFISNYKIKSFTNKETIFRIIYNDTPDKFLSEFKSYGFNIDNSKSIWKIK